MGSATPQSQRQAAEQQRAQSSAAGLRGLGGLNPLLGPLHLAFQPPRTARDTEPKDWLGNASPRQPRNAAA